MFWCQLKTLCSISSVTLIIVILNYRHPGNEFTTFEYPRDQVYTAIDVGVSEQLKYPLSERVKLWSAVDATVVMAQSHKFKQSSGEFTAFLP